MDIVVALTPERSREIVTELVNRCSAAVRRYGGLVDKFIGDSIMVLANGPRPSYLPSEEVARAVLGQLRCGINLLLTPRPCS